MKHFLLLMHNDVAQEPSPEAWGAYIAKLKKNGHLGGGSSIGNGVSFKKGVVSQTVSHELDGYMVLNASDFEQAKELVEGNPTLQASGTVELRELPED